METYSLEEKKYLLKIARQAIETYLKNKQVIKIESENSKFSAQRGVFVTLNKNKQLRGCIGNIEAEDSLINSVIDNAISAAVKDPRFVPVEIKELKDLNIEISILTLPEKSSLEYIKIGQDGVMIKKGRYQATFLPQVWEHFKAKDDFMSELCQKCGLSADAYLDPEIEIYTYQAIVFSEKGLG